METRSTAQDLTVDTKPKDAWESWWRQRLDREFYDRESVDVAPELLGKILVRRLEGTVLAGRIVETEAYAPEDPASHSYRGSDRRNRTMFGDPAHLYVYKIYSIHDCANVVTGPGRRATAVLLRALDPLLGIDDMVKRRGTEKVNLLCSGPARLCQALGITLADDGTDLCGEDLFVADDAYRPPKIDATPRIGITKAADVPWRFVVPGNPSLSRKTWPPKGG